MKILSKIFFTDVITKGSKWPFVVIGRRVGMDGRQIGLKGVAQIVDISIFNKKPKGLS